MAKTKITELDSLLVAADADVLPIVDMTTPETKKITKEHLVAGLSEVGHTHVEDDVTNLDKYTKTEVDNLLLTVSGTTDHSVLDELDYASSGHTGFQPAGDYLTEANFTTYSGTLQSQITDIVDEDYLHTQVITPTADHAATGPQYDEINAGASITTMDCVYLHSDGSFYKANAGASATALGLLAVSLETKTSGNKMNVALPGCLVRDNSWTWTVGGTMYLAPVSGDLTQTIPSGANQVIRIVGYATHINRIFFNPDNTYIIHS